LIAGVLIGRFGQTSDSYTIPINEKSIAVLPFDNLSNDHDDHIPMMMTLSQA
jgi:TolB-like protein